MESAKLVIIARRTRLTIWRRLAIALTSLLIVLSIVNLETLPVNLDIVLVIVTVVLTVLANSNIDTLTIATRCLLRTLDAIVVWVRGTTMTAVLERGIELRIV